MRAGVYDLSPRQPVAHTTPWGQWVTRSRVEVIGNTSADRRVILLAPLVWRDPDGTEIETPEGLLSDGASLPRSTWWLMGGRLALDYLRSALVHDFACRQRTGSSVDATTRFYRGLRADGMAFWRADTCRVTVRHFGPQWGPA
jgi:hypothetical protein